MAEELHARHPEEWARVSAELASAMKQGEATAAAWVRSVKIDAERWRLRIARSRSNPTVVASAAPHLLREQLARHALQRTATTLASGRIRLGLWSGTVIQKLLFARDLERKPASLRAFRFWWPFVFDRRLLMPLVQPRGIYCFYSRELISALAHHIDGRDCLELAAGDGTLSRFLRAAGVNVRATDDGSWKQVTTSPDVERLDAKAALRRYAPKVVLCSWPPADNTFERAVFETKSVELYVVIGSQHRHAAGNTAAWERQRAFTCERDERLSAMVLPPELDPAVFVFRRRA